MLNVYKDALSITIELYGTTNDKDLYKVTLKNETVSIDVINLGCCITAIYTPGRDDAKKNIVAGFKDLEDYENNRDYFGCILGRYANRIAGGSFFLDGKNTGLTINDGTNHLHGGIEGFNKKIWDITSVVRYDNEVSVTFEYLSSDGEEGYPGNLRVKVKYMLNNKNQLCIEYYAETDKATPVNLSNHSYFNLTGFETPVVTNHILQINAMSYTEKNEQNVPTGNIVAVSGTPLDFQSPLAIGTNIDLLTVDQGFDHNFIFTKKFEGEVVLAAFLKEPETGRTLHVYTDQPAMQLYTANFWDGTIFGQQGIYYTKHGAVALETQSSPDSPNQPSFPNTILSPGGQYFSTTIYEFGIE